jgi:TPP-dependent pyruvate/acetoin dehydrogenase alpha subunit
VPEAIDALSHEQALNIYRQLVYNREFELQVAEALREKQITTPTYLAVGQEHIAPTLAHTFPKPMIFAQHRAHPYYLSFGGDPAALRDELLGLDSGCAQGKGGSASIHDPAIPMFGHSGLMGDQIPIAVGAAIASGRATLAVTGDASVEEDYVFGAMGYAQAGVHAPPMEHGRCGSFAGYVRGGYRGRPLADRASCFENGHQPASLFEYPHLPPFVACRCGVRRPAGVEPI